MNLLLRFIRSPWWTTHPVATHALFAFMAIIASVVGRSTQIHGSPVALVWPASGLLLLWLVWAWRSTRQRVIVIVLMISISIFANATSGLAVERAALFAVATVMQSIVTLRLLQWKVPQFRLTSLSAFFHMVFSAIVGASVGGVVTAALFYLASAPDASSLILPWIVRNATGICAIGGLGLVLAYGRSRPTPLTLPRVAEGAALILTSFGAHSLSFGLHSAEPLFFITLPVGIWVALRFSTPWAMVHSLLGGAFLVVLTLANRGPFHDLDPANAAYIAQLYMFAVLAVTATLAFNRDERDELVASLRRSNDEAQKEAELRDVVLSAINEGIIVADPSGTIILQNDASRDLLGPEAPENLQHWLGDYQLYTPQGAKIAPDQLPLARALRGETIEKFELDLKLRGATQNISVDAVPLARSGGESQGAVAVSRDITEEKRQHAQLTRFAAVIAHDLKNPLTVFDGWLELLREPDPTGDIRTKSIDQMERASQKMKAMIEGLLAYSLAKEEQVHPQTLVLRSAVASVAGLFTSQQPGRELPRVDNRVSPECTLQADKYLLDQLLQNLLSNAIKYSDPHHPGPVVVSARSSPLAGLVSITVSDEGIGVPAADVQNIFVEFHRSSNGKSHTSGTGLGLSICRRIVEAHGGTISMRPGAVRGSVFEFTLPGAMPAEIHRFSENPMAPGG